MEGTHEKPLLGHDSSNIPPKNDVESNTKIVFKNKKRKCGRCNFCCKVLCIGFAILFFLLLLSILLPIVKDLNIGPVKTDVEWSVPHTKEREIHLRSLTERINRDSRTKWKARYNPFAHSADVLTLSSPIEMGREKLSEVIGLAAHTVKEGLSPEDRMADTIEHLRDIKKVYPSVYSALPTSFDAREKWSRCSSIHQISNQGACGSCWAMAATTVMSDRLCISSNFTRQETISAQDLLSCCPSCGSCGGGGFLISPFKTWKDRGFVSGGSFGSNEGCKPYQINNQCGYPCAIEYYTKNRTPKCEEKCNPLYGKKYKDDLIKSRQAYWLRSVPYYEDSVDWRVSEQNKIRDAIVNEMMGSHLAQPSMGPRQFNMELLLKTELFVYGPVMGCLIIGESFLLYDSGIFDFEYGDLMYSHCMRLIGWGEEGGVKYWTYANSWGRNWGENGFIRIDMSSIPADIAAGIF